MVLDTPRGLLPLHPGRKAADHTTNGFPLDATFDKSQSLQGVKQQSDQTFQLRRSVYSNNQSQQVPASAAAASALSQSQDGGDGNDENKIDEGFGCDVCGVDCTRVRYHHLTQRNFELCPACYAEGRFPSNMSTGDFVRLDQSPAPGPDGKEPWSAQERLLLLEGLEMYDEDWDKVASHVGGRRSKEECIAHFLQLPIEDQYLAQNDVDLGPLRYKHSSLSSNDNPVLSVVSFLASIVDPKVAAAAAEQAKGALMSNLKAEAEKHQQQQQQTSQADEEPGEAGAEGATGDTTMQDATNEGKGERAEEPVTGDEDESKPELESDEAPIKRAARAAIGTAAAKAHLVAQAEDRELHQLVRQAVSEQVKKLEGKMSAFNELEHLLELERRSVEQAKSQLMTDRINLVGHMNRLQDAGRKLAAHLPDHIKEEVANMNLPGFASTSTALPAKAVKVDEPQQPGQTAESLSFGQMS